MKTPMKAHFLAIGMLLLMSVAASAALNEGFETGYGEGVVLSGQNGWSDTGWGVAAYTKADAGRLPSGLWGVLIGETNSGARIAHGENHVLGDTITISSDIYVGADQAARLGLAKLGGNGPYSYPYLSVEINTGPEMWIGFEAVNTSFGYARISNVMWNDLAVDEWYKVTMSYILGGDANIEVLRYSTGQTTTRIATAAEIGNILSPTDITSLDGIMIEGWTGTRFDNIQAGPVPEPASMTLLGLGALSLLLRKRAKKV